MTRDADHSDRIGLAVHPDNRIGRLDGFFHFIIGYFAPTLYALRETKVDGVIGVEASGPFDHFWSEVRQHRIEVLPKDSTALADAPVHLKPRGFDSPTGHARTAWMPVRRSVLKAFGIDPSADSERPEGAPPRILVIDRARGIASESDGLARGADRRSVENMPEIIEALRGMGDVDVRLFEGLSLAEQMRLTREADIIVAQHGAVMANLLWARRGTRVIEIVTAEKEKVFTSYYEGLGVSVSQIPQEDIHDPVDIDQVLDAVRTDPGEVQPRSRQRARSERTSIRWSARAWKRHENNVVDERDSQRWLAALDRWPRPELDPTDDPIFLLTSIWRSGSTLLQRLLMSDPQVLIWGEPFAQRDPVRQLTDMFLPFSENYPTEHHFITGKMARDDFSLTDSWVANMYPSIEDLQRSHRAMIDSLLAQPARAHGFARWGMKEIRLDAYHGEYLQRLYPNCRLIFLIRNPYKAFASYIARAGWYERYPDRPVFDALSFAQQWKRTTESFLERGAHLGAFTITFEDMTTKPEVLGALADYTGTSIDPAVLQVKRRGEESALPAEIHPKEMRVLVNEMGDLAASLGYHPLTP